MNSQSGFKYTQVKAAGSAVVQGRAGRLVRVVCNTAFTGTVILYDNASGTSAVEIANIANPAGAVTLDYDASMKAGLYHQSSGTPAVTILTE